jgi:hypothetical protein
LDEVKVGFVERDGTDSRAFVRRKSSPYHVKCAEYIMALLKYENKNLKNALRDKDG